MSYPFRQTDFLFLFFFSQPLENIHINSSKEDGKPEFITLRSGVSGTSSDIELIDLIDTLLKF